jgi:exodeoxyribonuclease-3
VISLYLPSGSSSDERQQRKIAFMTQCLPIFKRMANDTERDYIICADWNICHTELDLKNWKANRKNSGFLPEERTWMDDLLNIHGFSDSYRELHPEKEQYTWWSNRGQAYANDVGWRLDYMLVTGNLVGQAAEASVFKEIKFSDHAPLIIDYHGQV